ncbi:MAG: ABC transporter permease [Planifilum sp.]
MKPAWKINLETVGVIAEKEMLDAVRNRWFHVFVVFFFLLSASITYFGLAGSGGIGLESFNRATASLLNLILFVIPLFTLILGGSSITGEREQGTWMLLMSKPITAAELVLGKYLGLASSMVLAIMIGFGLIGILTAFRFSPSEAKAYFMFVLLSILLTLSFLSLAILISAAAKRRVTAVVGGIIGWFVAVMLYDIAVMGGAKLFAGKMVDYFLLVSLLANPVDSIRILGIVHLGGETVFGPSLVSLTRLLSDVSSNILLLSGITIWMVVPLSLAISVIQRRGGV